MKNKRIYKNNNNDKTNNTKFKENFYSISEEYLYN